MSEFADALHGLIGVDGAPITLPQMIVRAVLVLLIGLALVRVATPRIFGKATPLDIVIAVIIGSNLSRTLTGNAPFLEVIAATVALVALHALIAHAAARWRPLATLVKGRPHVLVQDGEIDAKAMKQAAIGERDLEAAIRRAGASDVGDVRMATLERGGRIDVVLKHS